MALTDGGLAPAPPEKSLTYDNLIRHRASEDSVQLLVIEENDSIVELLGLFFSASDEGNAL